MLNRVNQKTNVQQFIQKVMKAKKQDSDRVEIYFSARGLADLDIVSVTDSFLIVYVRQTNKPREKVLETKIYWNDLNPDYAETLIIDYIFEIRQVLEIEVYHEASPPKLIGSIQASIGSIFGARMKGLKIQIIDDNKNDRGLMTLKCQKLKRDDNTIIQFDVQGYRLPSSSCGLCSIKYIYRLYKVKKILQTNSQYLLHESQPIKGISPKYGKLKINMKKLCNNNEDNPIYLKIFKYSEMWAPKQIASTIFTLRHFMKDKELSLSLKDSQQKTKGRVTLKNIKKQTKYEFSDYLHAGMEMALVICIDYTKSNLLPSDPNSLHYTTPQKKSQYQQALNQVTTILMDYDTDKLVPTYGFGAKVHMPNFNTGEIVHNYFPLNGDTKDPNLKKVEGVMKGYRESMKYLEFGGPTQFAPLLRQAMKECEKMKRQRKQYMILLILTDGQICDKDIVQDLLVKCGKLPLSVVIIGIGHNQGDWSIMHELGDDNCQMVDFQGNKTIRDLVQFVQFQKHQNNGVQLARQVLFELPRQVQEYHQLNDLTPADYRINLDAQAQKNRNKKH